MIDLSKLQSIEVAPVGVYNADCSIQDADQGQLSGSVVVFNDGIYTDRFTVEFAGITESRKFIDKFALITCVNKERSLKMARFIVRPKGKAVPLIMAIIIKDDELRTFNVRRYLNVDDWKVSYDDGVWDVWYCDKHVTTNTNVSLSE